MQGSGSPAVRRVLWLSGTSTFGGRTHAQGMSEVFAGGLAAGFPDAADAGRCVEIGGGSPSDDDRQIEELHYGWEHADEARYTIRLGARA
jgi:hypothetical protein